MDADKAIIISREEKGSITSLKAERLELENTETN